LIFLTWETVLKLLAGIQHQGHITKTNALTHDNGPPSNSPVSIVLSRLFQGLKTLSLSLIAQYLLGLYIYSLRLFFIFMG